MVPPIASLCKNGRASDTLMPGSSYSAYFDHPGNYDYLCSIHPYMSGKILVISRQQESVVQ